MHHTLVSLVRICLCLNKNIEFMTVSGSFLSFVFFTVSSFSPSLMSPFFLLRCLCFSFSCWGGVTTCLDCLFGVAIETCVAVLPLCAYSALCLCWLCDGAAVLLHAWWPHLDTDPNLSNRSASSDCVMDSPQTHMRTHTLSPADASLCFASLLDHGRVTGPCARQHGRLFDGNNAWLPP